ncbi:MAG: STAS domain-containing protein [Candidatus Promineifilaceae bacterium]|nr:STAS domain-containing protein [Candidatus Promineifilaceae bacterium]
MPEVTIAMNVRPVNSAISVIDIEGEVTAVAENVMMEAYSEASANGARAIVLNFSGLEYMNSSGIGLLVTMLIRAQRQKQQLLAYGLDEHYQQIFELTRLNEAIAIYGSEAEALTAARNGRR